MEKNNLHIDRSLLPEGMMADQSDPDLETLSIYAQQVVAPNCFVEIGTFKGGSSLAISQILQPGVETHTVDPLDQVVNKSDKIHYIVNRSVETSQGWDKPIGALFIDADHNRAMEDFLAWEKFVVLDGYILFHDYAPQHSPQVVKDCDQIIRTYRNYKPCKRIVGSSIFIIKKISNI